MTPEIRLRFDSDGVNWTEAAELMRRAPLNQKEPHALKTAFDNSDLICCAWHTDTLVGMARALSDGIFQSVIYDVCILPEYQGNHLGTRIMREMLDRLQTPNVILWAVPGKEAFYTRFGFHPMRTAMGRFENPERSAQQGYILLEGH
ncbi:GNAT family N-acetyltransferase [Pseudodesulfovibrio sp. JC047]|uniref:GNAT family N-acetyltransferase n=1 Tax=Pseudodesulfovibrio sp. JC047 TaxID=2683199 RepID=UPI0013D78C9B|nr:GNAT family N-acetyltransferase [Pseudodesulfovibrio sp. JC047]NDV18428.1 GNAT family N-acetyltransferase [Pseudodesulfovibrio sp. JC047]